MKMAWAKIGIHIIVFFICISICCTTSETDNDDNDPKSEASHSHTHNDTGYAGKFNTSAPLIIYRKLLKQKREQHKEAVASIMNLQEKYEKQYKMIEILLTKIFKVLSEAMVKIREFGLIASDPFPTNEKKREEVSKVVENAAFFGDIVLHLPDITHTILNRNKDWQLTLQWSVGFCNDSNIYEASEQRLLSLMAQEVGIIEKDPDFTNPYKFEAVEEIIDDEIDKLLKQRMKKEEKKKKKKDRMRGPRLGGKHTEL